MGLRGLLAATAIIGVGGYSGFDDGEEDPIRNYPRYWLVYEMGFSVVRPRRPRRTGARKRAARRARKEGR